MERLLRSKNRLASWTGSGVRVTEVVACLVGRTGSYEGRLLGPQMRGYDHELKIIMLAC